ncbi:reverse transcriptase domain-containing protein, partial [Tanacetum coccineum]
MGTLRSESHKDGTTRTKKYEELSATEKIQADCDCKATNIILQGLPPDVYAIVNHHKVAKEIWDRVKLLMQGTKLFAQLINNMNVINMSMRPVQVNTKFLNSLPPEWSLAVLVFNQGDDLISCLNKAMDFLTVGRQGQSYAGNSYKGNATSLGGNNTGRQARVVKCYNCQGEGHMARQCTQPKRPRNAAWFKEKAMLAEAHEAEQILDEEQLAFPVDPGIPDGQGAQTTIPNITAFQTEDLDAYDSDCDDVSNAKAVLMANLSSYGSDVLSEVPHSETSLNDMINQSVHTMHGFEQTPIIDFTDNEITSDSITGSLYPKTYRELLPKEILGAITQRDTGSYYPKRYWELLPKEILGAITQRDNRSYYPKRDWMSYGKIE